MANYLPKQSFTVNKFTIDIYPFLNPPDDPKEQGAALQYGADFRVAFNKGPRSAEQYRHPAIDPAFHARAFRQNGGAVERG